VNDDSWQQKQQQHQEPVILLPLNNKIHKWKKKKKLNDAPDSGDDVLSYQTVYIPLDTMFDYRTWRFFGRKKQHDGLID